MASLDFVHGVTRLTVHFTKVVFHLELAGPS